MDFSDDIERLKKEEAQRKAKLDEIAETQRQTEKELHEEEQSLRMRRRRRRNQILASPPPAPAPAPHPDRRLACFGALNLLLILLLVFSVRIIKF